MVLTLRRVIHVVVVHWLGGVSCLPALGLTFEESTRILSKPLHPPSRTGSPAPVAQTSPKKSPGGQKHFQISCRPLKPTSSKTLGLMYSYFALCLRVPEYTLSIR